MTFSRIDKDGETLLVIEGVLDSLTVPEIRPTIDAIVEEKRMSVVVELSGLRVIDSSGVGVVVSLYKRCRAYGGVVGVEGVQAQPLAIFKLLRLDRVFGT